MEDGRLGKYVISGILGKGAMGTVYDAHDPIIDRRVAIKTLTLPDAGDTETQEELARFKREAQAAGASPTPTSSASSTMARPRSSPTSSWSSSTAPR